MSHLTQMAGLTVQNFVSAAVGIAVAVALVRGLDAAAVGDDRELLGRPHALDDPRPAPALARARARARRARASSRRSRGQRRRRRSRGRRRRSLAGPSRARRRSRSSARTAAAPATRTPRTRSRTRTPFTNLLEMFALLAIPFALTYRVRPSRRRPAPGLGDLRRDVRPLDRLGGHRDWPSKSRATRASRRPARADAREHGGQGGPFRRGRDRPLRRVDDRHLDRRGDRRTRQLHAARRRRSAREHDARRGSPGRRRRGAVRDARSSRCSRSSSPA